MGVRRALVALALTGTAAPALAGPPYLTDDPVPTDTGHWEIYAFAAGEGRHSTLDADAGFDLNYGPVKGVQLTATLPVSFSHAPVDGWQSGTGDLEVGAKYRFLEDESRGLSAAIFPRIILPTASHAPGEKTRFLLPLWLGKDFAGETSLFGGGGYTINPGAGNRDFWQAAVAQRHLGGVRPRRGDEGDSVLGRPCDTDDPDGSVVARGRAGGSLDRQGDDRMVVDDGEADHPGIIAARHAAAIAGFHAVRRYCCGARHS